MSQGPVIYAGHFDPFTLGHLDIVQRGCRVFSKVIIAVAKDSPKSALFSAEDRTDMIRRVFEGNSDVEIDSFDGLLINYMKKKKVSILLRGIRTVSDFEYEFQMALANKKMNSDIETFFMMTGGNYSYLSSTLIKEIVRLGGDVSCMLPKEVTDRIKEIYASKS